MAVEDRAHTEFTSILNNLDRKFEIIHSKWAEDKFYEIKFRTQIQRNSDDFNALCDNWVDLFSEVTSTIWVKKISNTGPKIRFRKQYQCWTQGGKVVQKELLFDARRCKGTLDMKVLTDNPLTRRKNKHIRLGLNVVVKINFTHLHKVDINQPYAFFVHICDPLPEPPKPNIQPNDKLPKLVAEMVQKGLNASPKVLNPINMQQEITNQQQNILQNAQHQNTIQMNQHPNLIQTSQQQNQLQTSQQNQLQGNHHQDMQEHKTIDLQNSMITDKLTNDLIGKSVESSQNLDGKIVTNEDLIQNSLHVAGLEQSMHLNQVVSLQNMDAIKLQVQPQLQQLTQVVVSAPQLELNEPLLMCQPTLMFDPTQVIPVSTLPQFIHVHSHNIHNQQGHFL